MRLEVTIDENELRVAVAMYLQSKGYKALQPARIFVAREGDGPGLSSESVYVSATVVEIEPPDPLNRR